MSNTFRDRVESTAEVSPTATSKGDGANTHNNTIEPPYTDYEKIQAHPYLVDHFKLGSMWQETFHEEVKSIDTYLKNEIGQGRIDNSVDAIKETLKKAERMCGSEKSERLIVRMGVLTEYIKFLDKTRDIRLNSAKYGSTKSK